LCFVTPLGSDRRGKSFCIVCKCSARSDYAFSMVLNAGFEAKTMTVTVERVYHE
jgi:hypothetical protein